MINSSKKLSKQQEQPWQIVNAYKLYMELQIRSLCGSLIWKGSKTYKS
ncbi:unnamed protein product [Paramecium sonneborni]|uniref:Uncharacterized protein n=1 Tax=Paramecium sonneborni TaxID=65129 RepID=A0A8S1RFK4_9CILI|nr:unnamed protein product [Paramecium sonneborni]